MFKYSRLYTLHDSVRISIEHAPPSNVDTNRSNNICSFDPPVVRVSFDFVRSVDYIYSSSSSSSVGQAERETYKQRGNVSVLE
jgi:hypothetical protein